MCVIGRKVGVDRLLDLENEFKIYVLCIVLFVVF